MRILFVSDVLSYGGASRLLSDMMPIVRASGHTCSCLILTDRRAKYIDSLRAQGFTIDIVPEKCRGHIPRIRYIGEYIRKGRFDIVHVNLFPMTYYCSIIKHLCKGSVPPMIMTEHSTDNRRRHIPVLKPIEKYIYSAYSAVISISDKTRTRLLEWIKPSKSSKTEFVTIENGIPLDRFSHAASLQKHELIPDFGDGDCLLLMAGSFTEQKNHAFIVEVMERLPERYKLFFAGEGPLMPELVRLVSERRLNDRIIFGGFRSDMPELMNTADIVVIPSKWEGFGLIAAEAMAAGKPVVASDVEGLAEVVGDGGIRVPLNDTEGFVRALTELGDDEIYAGYSRNGAARSQRYDIGKMTADYLDLFRHYL